MTYYEKIKFVKSKLTEYLKEIYGQYNNELTLLLGGLNLLQNANNCLESSTATGYILEEFVVSKLEDYTKDHGGAEEIRVERIKNHGTQKSSYDCFVNYDNVLFLINAKAEKKYNNGVAAINILHNDYALCEPDKEKAYLVLKTHYDFKPSDTEDDRKIKIKDVSCYALEEIDFSQGHVQDYRNWSKKYKSESGRLQVTKTFKNTHVLNEADVSYLKTRQFIEDIYQKNKQKNEEQA